MVVKAWMVERMGREILAPSGLRGKTSDWEVVLVSYSGELASSRDIGVRGLGVDKVCRSGAVSMGAGSGAMGIAGRLTVVFHQLHAERILVEVHGWEPDF